MVLILPLIKKLEVVDGLILIYQTGVKKEEMLWTI